MSTPQMSEPRAKRTHARRSCELCKVRKTRCELPDLDVISSPSPLPPDKSCHRCRVLALPCVVDDTAKKSRKRGRDDMDTIPTSSSMPATLAQVASSSTPNSPKRKGKPRARVSSPGPSRLTTTIIDPNLDIIHSFDPLSSPDDVEKEQQQPIIRPTQSVERSLKYHGRPLELASAMLQSAYSRGRPVPCVGDMNGDVDLIKLVNQDVRNLLKPGVAQLQIFHPYLDNLDDIFGNYKAVQFKTWPPIPVGLTLALVLYLSSLTLAPDTNITQLRSVLTPYISAHRDYIMVHLSSSFQTIQALELLSLHAPFGVLPLELVDPASLGVARGQVLVATHISQLVGFHPLMQTIMQSGMSGLFSVVDTWLWLGLCIAEAAVRLEDETPKVPDNLAEAREIVDSFFDDELELWQSGFADGEIIKTIGKLTVCDRLSRVSEVFNSIIRLRGYLETAVEDSNFDPVTAITDEFKHSISRLEALDERHDAIIALVPEGSRNLLAGWLSYRNIRRRYDSTKIYVTGLRFLTATGYLPGHPSAFPNLPTDLPPSAKVPYAVGRASNPADTMPFILSPGPGSQALWQWGVHRGDTAEQVLVAFLSIGSLVIPSPTSGGELIPLHDVISIAVDCAKVLMEMQAGSILIHKHTGRLHKAFRVPQWVFSMRQVAQVMAAIATLSPINDELSRLHSLAGGCSSLIGSMVRIADGWTRSLESEAALVAISESEVNTQYISDPTTTTNSNSNSNSSVQPVLSDPKITQDLIPTQQQNSVRTRQSPDSSDQSQPPQNGLPLSTSNPTSVHNHNHTHNHSHNHSHGSTHGHGHNHQQYMDSSDRWMASDHTRFSSDHSRTSSHPTEPAQPGQSSLQSQSSQPGQIPGQGQAGGYLDQMLSDMFTYAYGYPNIQQRPTLEQNTQDREGEFEEGWRAPI
ncbi:hypothetical protein TREMEDRAFT_73361 [Tremella mesenterica DSM 1558]|uniref:uncharacterized protein n=1 Tax=Tremella mesenterica (strain ATCC 24925 / CBS 8224 / DSM 1558 / NBRC 9311 / NRRL Y-6157 / RJB 2259-6 / UBC 559-6) TaxID=578456 RepID=UPI0003F4A148|nr:uncharacterized protein TREMEDRAFT_73361 [Tremella mesenterica DSM 1558]EIW71637.1 hypothetical protein TREMEDRAFT_73361 [Tremella mesenterica DSM 1558]